MFSDIGGSLKQPADTKTVKQPTVQPNKNAHASLIASTKPPAPSPKVAPSKPTVVKQKIGPGVYALHFSIFYETIVGESIAVVGNLEELGLWVEYKCHLEWTDGHIWRSVEPIIIRESYFEYKYVLLEEGKVVAWEEGVNRIADLDALPEVTDKAALKNMMELMPAAQ